MCGLDPVMCPEFFCGLGFRHHSVFFPNPGSAIEVDMIKDTKMCAQLSSISPTFYYSQSPL